MQQPSFDTWTTIFLFAAIQGLFVATVLFFVKRKEFKANSLLALLILLFSLTLIEYVLYWTAYIYYFPHVMSLSDGFPFLFGVILYFYFEKIFEGHQLSKKDYLHFLPFLLYLVYMMPRYLSAAEVKQMWILGKISNAFMVCLAIAHSQHSMVALGKNRSHVGLPCCYF